jgi:hypothetical protein
MAGVVRYRDEVFIDQESTTRFRKVRVHSALEAYSRRQDCQDLVKDQLDGALYQLPQMMMSSQILYWKPRNQGCFSKILVRDAMTDIYR